MTRTHEGMPVSWSEPFLSSPSGTVVPVDVNEVIATARRETRDAALEEAAMAAEAYAAECDAQGSRSSAFAALGATAIAERIRALRTTVPPDPVPAEPASEETYAELCQWARDGDIEHVRRLLAEHPDPIETMRQEDS